MNTKTEQIVKISAFIFIGICLAAVLYQIFINNVTLHL